jgi:CubicO group peptidase (beta-lactamase class C family)
MYNTGAQVLGVLAARAAGQSFSEVLRTRIFEPLGMRDTGFWTADTHRFATAYQPTPDGLAVWDEPDGKSSRPPAFGDGGAGLVSTARHPGRCVRGTRVSLVDSIDATARRERGHVRRPSPGCIS